MPTTGRPLWNTAHMAIRRPVSLLDVGPTILGFAGVKLPATYRGKDLFDETERAVVTQASESSGDLSDGKFTGIAIIARGYKLFRWKDKKYLFRLEDSKERENLYDKEVEVVAELERQAVPYTPGSEYESSVPDWPPRKVG